MDLEIIKKIFSIGKYLALTPANTQNMSPTLFRKFYAIFVFSLYAFDTINSIYFKKSFFSQMSMIQLVLRLLSSADLFAHSFYTVIVVGLLKQHKWSVLMKNLKTVESKNSTTRSYVTFVVSHILLFIMTTFTFYVWIKYFGYTSSVYTWESIYKCTRFFSTICRRALSYDWC
jgi:hypothetical protein